MSSPYNAGRDSNAGRGNAFDQSGDNQDNFVDGFRSPSGSPTGERDYRDTAQGGGGAPPRGADGPQQTPGRFTYPSPGAAGRLADD